jgi:hypothetical protein
MLNRIDFEKCSIHIDNNCNHGNPIVKNAPTFMLTFLLFKKVGLLYGRVGAGTASNFIQGAGAKNAGMSEYRIKS